MKAFWWFRKNSIAGMARPGFNGVPWFEIPFDEALILGWIGKHTTGTHNLNSFRTHLKHYTPLVAPYYPITQSEVDTSVALLLTENGFLSRLNRLAERMQVIEDIKIQNDQLTFQISRSRLEYEIKKLKSHGINRVVCLTENHNEGEFLSNHFKTDHISIVDLTAPQVEQAHQLADIIAHANQANEKIAIHCLAGIGRTSTMIIASHILQGEDLEKLRSEVKKQNRYFSLSPSQEAFLKALIKK
jgi:protein-tyrosine phosphatase